MPKAGNTYKVQFSKKELRKINKFFYRNADFVHYMEQRIQLFDHQFFTETIKIILPFTPMTDYYQFPEFSTSQDMLWASKVMLSIYSLHPTSTKKRLKVDDSDIFREKKHKVLVWTGPKTALTELIYALFSNGTINHGAADIIR
jgi:hypothetical protein